MILLKIQNGREVWFREKIRFEAIKKEASFFTNIHCFEVKAETYIDAGNLCLVSSGKVPIAPFLYTKMALKHLIYKQNKPKKPQNLRESNIPSEKRRVRSQIRSKSQTIYRERLQKGKSGQNSKLNWER